MTLLMGKAGRAPAAALTQALTHALSAAVAAGLAALAPAAAAQEEAPAWSVGVGVKAWATRWATWQIGLTQVNDQPEDYVSQLESGLRVAWVPVLGVRRGRLFATTSWLARTTYTLDSQLVTRRATREEVDANLGWDLSDNLSASLGVKRIVQSAGGRFLWRGPVLGLAANAPLGGPLSMYGTLGVGRLRIDLPKADADGRRRMNADYTLGEWGLAWRRQGDSAEAASRHVLTLGYRLQVVRTGDYALRTQPRDGAGSMRLTRESLRDVTEGWSFAWAYSF